MLVYLTDALTNCNQALWNGADIKEACRNLGNVLQALGRFDEAVDWHARAIQPQPDRAELFACLGRLYAQQQQWTESIAAYQQTLRLQPHHAGAFWSLANIYAHLGKSVEEAECRQQAMKQKPEWSTAQNQFNLGNLLLKQSLIAEAIEAYQTALSHQPDFAVAQHNLAMALSLQGSLSQAIDAYRQALVLDPNYYAAYLGLGKALEKQQNLPEAIDCYRKAISLKPSGVDALYALGQLLVQQGAWAEMVSIYQEAIAQAPSAYWSHYYLGCGLLWQGQLAGAVEAFRQSVALNIDTPWAYQHLVKALWQLQRHKEAIEAAEQQIEKYPNFAWAYGLLGNILAEQGEVERVIVLNEKANVLHGWQQAGEKHYEFTRDWFTHNIPIWQQHLSVFAHKPGIKALEIGSYEGRSACWLLNQILTNLTSSITCLDIHFQDRFHRNIDRTGQSKRVIKLEGNSLELLPTLAPLSYDLIYIDGCHLADHVRQESVLCWKLLKPGGILIFDDYEFQDAAHPGQDPKPVINQFLATLKNDLEVLHHAYQVIVCKTR